MRVLLIAQHGQEDLEGFHQRVNTELARLGSQVKNVQMSCCLHERSLGGRIQIPTMLFSLMITYEEPA